MVMEVLLKVPFPSFAISVITAGADVTFTIAVPDNAAISPAAPMFETEVVPGIAVPPLAKCTPVETGGTTLAELVATV